MQIEQLYLHKGIGCEASEELLAPGFLPYYTDDGLSNKTSQNWFCEQDGILELRPAYYRAQSDSLGSWVYGIWSFSNCVWALSGGHLYHRLLASGTFVDKITMTYGEYLTSGYYKKFLFLKSPSVARNHIMVDESGNVYYSVILPPAPPCSGTGTGSGSLTGVYKLYVSYLIIYPNGMKYETGLSAASSDVTLSGNASISWSNIPTATTSGSYSTALLVASGSTVPTVHRKLYRGPGTGGTLADIYYVGTIADNTTTTYTDTATDATLISNGVCDVKNFTPMGTGHIFAFHYGRYYEADQTYPWRLNYSEPAYGDTASDNELLLPIAMKSTNWNDIRPVAMGTVDFITAIVSWGTTLYIGYGRGWIKKAGEDPTTWSMKKTSATVGPQGPEWLCTMDKPFGIVYLAKDENNKVRMYVFDGDNSVKIGSPQLDKIFDTSVSLTRQTRMRRCGSSILLQAAGAGYSWELDFSRYPDIRVRHNQGYQQGTYGPFSCVETVKPTSDTGNGGRIYGTAAGYVFSSNNIVYGGSNPERVTSSILYFPRRNGGEQRLANMTKVLKKLRYNIFPGKYSAGGGSYPYSEARIAVYLDGDTTTVKWGQSGIAYWSVTTEGKGEIPFPPNTRCKTYRIVVTFVSDPGESVGYTYMPKVYMPWDVLFDIVED